GSSDVEANAPRRINSEVFECAFELYTTAACKLLEASDDFDAGIFRDGSAGFVHALTIHLDFTSKNHGDGFLRRIGEASLKKKKIEAFAADLGLHEGSHLLGSAKHKKFRDLAEAS